MAIFGGVSSLSVRKGGRVRDLMDLSDVLNTFRDECVEQGHNEKGHDEQHERKIQEFCACLHDRDFYEMTRSSFCELHRGVRNENHTIPSATMARMMLAAKQYLPPPPVFDSGVTREGVLLVQRINYLSAEIAQIQGLPAMDEEAKGMVATLTKLIYTLVGYGEDHPEELAKHLPSHQQSHPPPQHPPRHPPQHPPQWLSQRPPLPDRHPGAQAQDRDTTTQTGVYNGGMTCYQNVIIRMLLQPLSLEEAQAKKDSLDVIGSCLVDLISHISNGRFSESKRTLEALWMNVARDASNSVSMFARGSQQDPTEFLNLVVFSRLENLLPQWKHGTRIIHKCSQCKFQESQLMEGRILTLPPGLNEPQRNLSQLIDDHGHETEDIEKHCNECSAQNASHSRTEQLGPLPGVPCPVLLISLNRFSSSPAGVFSKLQTNVRIPRAVFPVEEMTKLYYVDFVVVHVGDTIGSGHYFAFERDSPTASWRRVEDSTLAPASQADVDHYSGQWYVCRAVPFSSQIENTQLDEQEPASVVDSDDSMNDASPVTDDDPFRSNEPPEQDTSDFSIPNPPHLQPQRYRGPEPDEALPKESSAEAATSPATVKRYVRPVTIPDSEDDIVSGSPMMAKTPTTKERLSLPIRSSPASSSKRRSPHDVDPETHSSRPHPSMRRAATPGVRFASDPPEDENAVQDSPIALKARAPRKTTAPGISAAKIAAPKVTPGIASAKPAEAKSAPPKSAVAGAAAPKSAPAATRTGKFTASKASASRERTVTPSSTNSSISVAHPPRTTDVDVQQGKKPHHMAGTASSLLKSKSGRKNEQRTPLADVFDRSNGGPQSKTPVLGKKKSASGPKQTPSAPAASDALTQPQRSSTRPQRGAAAQAEKKVSSLYEQYPELTSSEASGGGEAHSQNWRDSQGSETKAQSSVAGSDPIVGAATQAIVSGQKSPDDVSSEDSSSKKPSRKRLSRSD